eukprot:gnl/Dysnectes_brevis/764_a839_5029.p1 GENE.gnl/Dysnectes_brevis/764_a839_5029~~gnl/Dysnectes_brevis/764_a839_5029.p1  ORF type:complete len:200 (-),score=20.20 gnl/Dysnectes_brevis/764_a839_5029:55-654(-)
MPPRKTTRKTGDYDQADYELAEIRSLECAAFTLLLKAFRANQTHITGKMKLIPEIAGVLNISEERIVKTLDQIHGNSHLKHLGEISSSYEHDQDEPPIGAFIGTELPLYVKGKRIISSKKGSPPEIPRSSLRPSIFKPSYQIDLPIAVAHDTRHRKVIDQLKMLFSDIDTFNPRDLSELKTRVVKELSMIMQHRSASGF